MLRTHLKEQMFVKSLRVCLPHLCLQFFDMKSSRLPTCEHLPVLLFPSVTRGPGGWLPLGPLTFTHTDGTRLPGWLTALCAWYTVEAYQAFGRDGRPDSDLEPFLTVSALGESSQSCVIFTISTCLGLGIT